jgi:hypothetical protein
VTRVIVVQGRGVRQFMKLASTQLTAVVAGGFLSRTNKSLIFSGYVRFTWSHGFIQCCHRNSLQLFNLNVSLCSEIVTNFLETLPKLAVERVAFYFLFGSHQFRNSVQGQPNLQFFLAYVNP